MLKENGFTTDLADIIFAGEDFSYYLEKCPGTYWALGVRQGKAWDHHTALFNPDEQQLWKGVAFWLQLALADSQLTDKETAPALAAAGRD